MEKSSIIPRPKKFGSLYANRKLFRKLEESKLPEKDSAKKGRLWSVTAVP